MNLKQLSQLSHSEKCKTSAYARRMDAEKLTDKSEKDLKKCIRLFCKLTKSGYFSSTPNKSSQVGEKAKLNSNADVSLVLSGLTTEKVNKTYGYSSGTDGMSDMHGHINVTILGHIIPVSIYLEIKIPGDTWKPNQKNFKVEVSDVNGWYVIIDTFESFTAMVDRIRGYYNQLFNKM